MKKEDLVYLKEELQKEIEKRDEIEKLLQQDNVKELVCLAEVKPDLFLKDDYELLTKILEKFKIMETNRVYVCTDAFYYGFEKDEDSLNSPFSKLDISIYDKRLYQDIESGKQILGCTDRDDCFSFSNRVYDEDFKNENIILNPYNTRKNKNGYEEVRRYFWENALKYGQSKSKKLLLAKYPRL